MASPLQLVDTLLHTFTAYSLAPGAMPLCRPSRLAPAAMSATWVPWPAPVPASIGFGSGCNTVNGAVPVQVSPTKS